MRQLAAEVFEGKVPDASDLALRMGPAVPAAAAPAADMEALPVRAAPAEADNGWRLPAALQSRSVLTLWPYLSMTAQHLRERCVAVNAAHTGKQNGHKIRNVAQKSLCRRFECASS